jgi:hypothetical protein
MKKHFLIAAFAALAHVAPAGASQDAYTAFIAEYAATLAKNAQVQSAIRVSNTANQSIDEATILDQDAEWRREIGTKNTAEIDRIMNLPASDELRKMVKDSGGKIVEVILMDNHGLNAAISNVTSDYWQGDEDKFQQTYGKGAGSVHVGEVEFDESAQAYVVQVSFVVTDAAGLPVGAATFSLNAEAF